MEIKKDGQQTLFGVKIRVGWIELYKKQVIVREDMMHISEDTQVPPDCVGEWK